MEHKRFTLKDYENLKLRVVLNKELSIDWHRVAYLIIDILRRHEDMLGSVQHQLVQGDKEFNQFVVSHVQKYIEKDIIPHTSIAGPIINIAEDIIAGREITLKGGDYIALRNGMEMKV